MLRLHVWLGVALVLALTGCGDRDEAKTPATPAPNAPVSAKAVPGPASGAATAEDLAAQKLRMLDAFKAMDERQKHPRRRRFNQGDLTPAQRELMERLRIELASKDLAPEKKLELLGQAGGIVSPELVGVVLTALDDTNEDVRVSAMELLSDLDEPAMLPAIEKGMKDESEQVRDAALSSLYYVSDPRVTGILSAGLRDSSELVRETALAMIAEQPEDARYQLYAESLQSANKDVFMEVVAQLEDESSHQTLAILFNGLRHPDETFRQETNDALDFLISHTFATYEEAVDWWNKNKQNYDDELFEKQF